MGNDSKITLLAKSSSGAGPYPVEFIFENNTMSIHCGCPAGKWGKFCKHKIRMLQGDYDILYDDDQGNQLDKITDWIQGSEFLDLIFERGKLEKVLKETQNNLNAVKKKMAEAMKNGIKQKA